MKKVKKLKMTDRTKSVYPNYKMSLKDESDTKVIVGEDDKNTDNLK